MEHRSEILELLSSISVSSCFSVQNGQTEYFIIGWDVGDMPVYLQIQKNINVKIYTFVLKIEIFILLTNVHIHLKFSKCVDN